MIPQTEVTPDIVKKFKAGSEKLKVTPIYRWEVAKIDRPFQANPDLLDDLISKLSPAAQAPAKKVSAAIC